MSTEQLTVPLGALCSLLMCSDPWPVDDHGEGDGRDALVAFADRVAQQAGFGGWLDAYHNTGNALAATLRQQAARVDEEARDRVAKAIADVIGHGMREKCYPHADAALEAALSAQPAPERQGEAIGEIDSGEDGCFVELYPDRDLPLGAKVYTHLAAPVGVPDGMVVVGRVEMARTKQHCRLTVPVCSNAILYARRESVPSIAAAPTAQQGTQQGEG